MKMNDPIKFEQMLKNQIEIYSHNNPDQITDRIHEQEEEEFALKSTGMIHNLERPTLDEGHTNARYNALLKIGNRFKNPSGQEMQKYAFLMDTDQEGLLDDEGNEKIATIGYMTGPADLMDDFAKLNLSARSNMHNRIWKTYMAHRAKDLQTRKVDKFGRPVKEGHAIANAMKDIISSDPTHPLYEKYANYDWGSTEIEWKPIQRYRAYTGDDPNKAKTILPNPESLALRDLFTIHMKEINAGAPGKRDIDHPGVYNSDGSPAWQLKQLLHKVMPGHTESTYQEAKRKIKTEKALKETKQRKSFESEQDKFRDAEFERWKANQKDIRTKYYLYGIDVSDVANDSPELFGILSKGLDIKKITENRKGGHTEGYTSKMSSQRHANMLDIRTNLLRKLNKKYGGTATVKDLVNEGYDVIYPDYKKYIETIKTNKPKERLKFGEATGTHTEYSNPKYLDYVLREHQEWEEKSRAHIDPIKQQDKPLISKNILNLIASKINNMQDVIINFPKFKEYMNSLSEQDQETIKKTIFEASLSNRPYTDIGYTGYSGEQEQLLQKGYEAAMIALPYYDKSKGASMATYLSNYVKAATQKTKGHKNIEVVLPTTGKAMVDSYPEIQAQINNMYVHPQYETYRRHIKTKVGK